jgi:hypothetical protein
MDPKKVMKMRPSWDWEHGTGDIGSGTPGHSGHTDPVDRVDEDESFFQAGDEGRYEGGPATVEEEPLELEDAPVAIVARTPEQDARRARLVRVVAMAVGAFAALFAFGVVKQQKAGASEPPARVIPKVEVPESTRRDVTPHPLVPAARPAEEPKPAVAAKPRAEPAPEPKKKASVVQSDWSAPVAPVVEAPSAPAPKPVTTTTVTPVTADRNSDFTGRGKGGKEFFWSRKVADPQPPNRISDLPVLPPSCEIS